MDNGLPRAESESKTSGADVAQWSYTGHALVAAVQRLRNRALRSRFAACSPCSLPLQQQPAVDIGHALCVLVLADVLMLKGRAKDIRN